MNVPSPAFSAEELSLRAGEVLFADLSPLIDGKAPGCGAPEVAATKNGWTVTWPIEDGCGQRFILTVAPLARSDGLA
ncbi:MAG: hypothetical protein ACRETX_07500, partial [Steroidobacteraceae bacterium]